MEMKKYEVIVVGGGHGGVEASLAAARLGKKTAMYFVSGYYCHDVMQSFNRRTWKK